MWERSSARKVLQKKKRKKLEELDSEEDRIQTGAYLQEDMAERSVIQVGAEDVRYFLRRWVLRLQGKGVVVLSWLRWSREDWVEWGPDF